MDMGKWMGWGYLNWHGMGHEERMRDDNTHRHTHIHTHAWELFFFWNLGHWEVWVYGQWETFYPSEQNKLANGVYSWVWVRYATV